MAYSDVLPAQMLAELTSPAAVAREAEWRSTHRLDGVLIAETAAETAADADADGPEADADGGGPEAGPIGFAAFGPERSEDDEPGWPGPQPPEHGRAELYAIYVAPDYWSSGAGQALIDGVLALAASSGYTDISLWVMEANERARRFYELAGFQVTGESAILGRLAGVTQIRYRRLVG